MQPARYHRVPQQRHNLILPTGAEGQALLEIPVIVPHGPKLDCVEKRKGRPSETREPRGDRGSFVFFQEFFLFGLSKLII